MNRKQVKDLLHDFDSFQGRAGIAKTLQRIAIAGFIVILGIATGGWQAIVAYALAGIFTIGILSKPIAFLVMGGFGYLAFTSQEIIWMIAALSALSYIVMPKK